MWAIRLKLNFFSTQIGEKKENIENNFRCPFPKQFFFFSEMAYVPILHYVNLGTDVDIFFIAHLNPLELEHRRLMSVSFFF